MLHASFSLIWYTTWPYSEKVWFWPFDPFIHSRGLGGGGSVRKNISYHVPSCVIPFNLVCNMTIFWKKNGFLPFDPPSDASSQRTIKFTHNDETKKRARDSQGEVGAPLNWFKPSRKLFYWLFQVKAVLLLLIFYVFSVLCLLCLNTRLFICTLWSPAGKWLTSWLPVVVSYCEFVTFPLVSWVRWGTWLYWFLIFGPIITLN